MPKICYIPKDFNPRHAEKIRLANAIIEEYVAQGFDLTLRQLYYQMVSRDYIANNIQEYNNLGDIITAARLAGLIDWNHIVDRTRHLQKQTDWQKPENIIKASEHSFHISRWRDQDYQPEVWIEKNALIGVIEPICNELDVPYFACIGYTSQTEIWQAAQRLRRYIESGKTPVILHLGDHDPSGIDMTRDIRDRISLIMETDMALRRKRFRGLEVSRIALNMDQINQYNPPPNPVKLSDGRAKVYMREYGYESWELDALSPTVIHDLIRTEVAQYIDPYKWADVEREEDDGRYSLMKVRENWDDVANYAALLESPDEEGEDADDEV